MANLIASDSTPTVTWNDTDFVSVDWRMISGGGATGPMKLEVTVSGTYTTIFEWNTSINKSKVELSVENTEPILSLKDTSSATQDFRIRANAGEFFIEENSSSGTWNSALKLTPSLNTSHNDFSIESSQPILTFSDSDGGAADVRIRVNSGAFFFEENSSGAWETILQTDNTYAYAVNGFGAGTTNQNHTLQWQVFTGALTTGAGSTSVTVTLGTVDVDGRKIVGAIVMITDATGDDVAGEYALYDYLEDAVQGKGYSVTIDRGTSGVNNNDIVHIAHDSSYDGGRYKIIAFYSPVI